MPTYNLDQNTLDQLLNGQLPGSTPLSTGTDNAIIDALFNAGLYPASGALPSVYQSDSGPFPTFLNMDTINPGGAQFFLELGSNHIDVVSQSSHPAVIAAGDGHNLTIIDLAGHDTLVGGGGGDTLIGGDGSYLIGGTGNNDLIGFGNDTLQGGDGADTMTAVLGNNTFIGGGGPETITAGLGNDTIYGGIGAESITSTGGHTTIYAGAGHETINAQVGFDTIYVGYDTSYSHPGGQDTIYAGGQSNTIIDVNQTYANTITGTAPDGNKLLVFKNGGVTTHVEISGHATINYLDGSQIKT